jgi:hypothetical protein
MIDGYQEYDSFQRNNREGLINYRKLTRTLFRIILVGLIVASCTQSVSWLGQVGIDTGAVKRYTPPRDNYYDRSNNTYTDTDVIYPDEDTY